MNYYFLKKIRKEKNISLKDAAATIGIHPNNLTLAESGKRTIPHTKIPALADLYGCSPAWLTDAPGIYCYADIRYYLKKLYLLEKRQYEVHYNPNHTHLVAVFKNITAFLDEWRSFKSKFKNGEISADEYHSWVYKQSGTGSKAKYNEKLFEIRCMLDHTRPGIENELTKALSSSFIHYQIIENGYETPTKREQNTIASVFRLEPGFLFDDFKFGGLEDVTFFLLAVDEIFGIVQIGEDGQVKFACPEIEMFFERILDLEQQYQSGKITKVRYEFDLHNL